MSFLTSLFGSGKSAANAATQAAGVASGAQTEARDYLQGEEDFLSGIRDPALQRLNQEFSQPFDQKALIDQARSSPLYAAILGSRKAGEEGILRNASATGHLRSGNSKDDIYSYNAGLENEALLQSYNQANDERRFQLSGIAGLAGLPSNKNNIAGLTAGIGETKAQGIVGAQQAREQAKQNAWDNALGIGKVGIAAFSDIRLKDNIRYVGERNGHAWYKWDWLPECEKIGLTGSSEGVLAHQVYEYMPEAITQWEGFVMVSYEKLGLVN